MLAGSSEPMTSIQGLIDGFGDIFNHPFIAFPRHVPEIFVQRRMRADMRNEHLGA
jgi:hypothetical protein